jgi:hypothetical protein
MSRLKDLTGKTFGKLTVLNRTPNRGKYTYWLCQCVCGDTVEVRGDHLTSKAAQSCGCNRVEATIQADTKHGMRNSKLYRIWNSIRQRCENPNSHEAYLYGGRGITVCEEWLAFENFMNWAQANGYSENLTIDRIDNNKGCSPDNCRWADSITQANNKRNNRRIDCNGRTQTLAQWAREYGVNYKKLWLRLKRGWDFGAALEAA